MLADTHRSRSASHIRTYIKRSHRTVETQGCPCVHAKARIRNADAQVKIHPRRLSAHTQTRTQTQTERQHKSTQIFARVKAEYVIPHAGARTHLKMNDLEQERKHVDKTTNADVREHTTHQRWKGSHAHTPAYIPTPRLGLTRTWAHTHTETRDGTSPTHNCAGANRIVPACKRAEPLACALVRNSTQEGARM
jgi:hypothetical protein